MTGTLNLKEISISLKERIKIKYTHKHLCRNILDTRFIMDMANDYILSQLPFKLSSEYSIIFRQWRYNLQCSKTYEYMSKVRDGSTGVIKD